MPAATSKHDLLQATLKEWGKLDALLDTVPEAIATVPDADGTSIKDVICHRAHWIDLFFQWVDAGEAAEMPDRGVKWNQLKAYNAELRTRYADLGWSQAKARLADRIAHLVAWLTESDEAMLYGRPMPGGNGKWTTGRYAEAAGPSHCRSAAKYVRSVMKGR